jgi:hypothetical protein
MYISFLEYLFQFTMFLIQHASKSTYIAVKLTAPWIENIIINNSIEKFCIVG